MPEPTSTIQISDQAINQIRTAARAEDVDLAAVMLRVAVVPGGCSGLSYELGWDTTLQETDEVSSMDEVRVVVDRKSALYLEGSRLDFSDGLEGEGFHFSNPQAARTCACGDSFGL
jgi:iron-sulfur cluster assembly protein